jgi:hypothetical protein
MSTVTGVILATHCVEDIGIFAEIQEWLAENERLPLRFVENYCCTGKHPQMHILGGGYNYLPGPPFAQFVMSRKWKLPECVVLVMQPEDGETEVHRPMRFTEGRYDER